MIGLEFDAGRFVGVESGGKCVLVDLELGNQGFPFVGVGVGEQPDKRGAVVCFCELRPRRRICEAWVPLRLSFYDRSPGGSKPMAI